MPKQESGTTIRLPEELKEPLRLRLFETKKSFKATVVELLADYLSRPAGAVALSQPTPPAAAEDRPQRYRKEHLIWHDRLELTLNDPEEALGIMKNLEWAEKAVLGKERARASGK